MTDLRTIRVVVTLAVEDDEDLDSYVDEVQDLVGGHPAVLTVEVER